MARSLSTLLMKSPTGNVREVNVVDQLRFEELGWTVATEDEVTETEETEESDENNADDTE